MEGSQEQGSEVARLLQKIREEYEAAQRGVSEIAYGTSKHQFVTQKMENMSRLHGELRNLVGDVSMALVAEQLEMVSDAKSSSA